MKGSSVPGAKTQGLPQGKVRGSSQAGGNTSIDGMGGMTMGSNVAGKNMVHVGGVGSGSSYPNMMKGGSKPKGTSIPAAKTAGLPQGKVRGSNVAGLSGSKIAKFHATRGASKL